MRQKLHLMPDTVALCLHILASYSDASGLTERFHDSFSNSYEDNYGLPLISIWILLDISVVLDVKPS